MGECRLLGAVPRARHARNPQGRRPTLTRAQNRRQPMIALLLSLLLARSALTQPPATAMIRGRVVRADGQPIAGARVRVVIGPSPSPSMAEATTDENGRYEISGAWPVPVRVAASKSGYIAAQYGESRTSEPGEAITIKPGDI